MLLKFYSRNKAFKGVLERVKDLAIEETLEINDKTMSFECQYSDIKALAENEGYIETPDDIFVIKEIDRNSTNATATIHAQLNLEELEGKAIKKFETVAQTIRDALNLAFVDTGWSITRSNVTKRRTLRMENVSALEILKKALKTYRCEIKINSLLKQIEIYEQIGTDRGVYFISDLNLKQVEVQSTTYDFYTEIIGYGKDDLQTEKLTNYTYSTKHKCFLWKDERYTILENLTEDAQAKLDDMAKPYKSYTGDLIDLANMSTDYDLLSFALGDVVWLIDDNTDVKEQQRIVGIVRYPDEPERTTFTLANKVLTFDELTQKYDDAADTVDNITADNGTISGSCIDGITAAQITNLDASPIIASLIEADRINANTITAVRGEFGEITANVGTFNELSANIFEANQASITNLIAHEFAADFASIGTLEANYANIVNLLSGVAVTGDLTTIQLTASNAVLESTLVRNAVMQNVTVNDLLAAEITAKQINAVEIDTNVLKLVDENGGMVIAGATQQFYDTDGNIRMQIGRDATDDFTFVLYDADGQGVMIDAVNGIHPSAIGDGIIVNDMVADNAGIHASKLDITSVFDAINSDGNPSINMSRIYYDEAGQSLTQLYAQMSNNITLANQNAANAVSAAEEALDALSGITTLDAMSVNLSNETHIVHVNADGTGGDYTLANTIVSAYLGSTDISASVTVTATPGTGVTGSYNSSTRTYQVSNMTVDEGYVDLLVTYNGSNPPTRLTKRFKLSKIPDGKVGYSYKLTSDNDVVVKKKNGTFSPTQIVFNAICNRGETSGAYMGKFLIETITGSSTSYQEAYNSTVASSSVTFTIPANTKAVRATLRDPLTSVTLDVKSVLVIADTNEMQSDILSVQTTMSSIQTSVNGLNINLGKVETELYGISDGFLLHQVLRTDDASGTTATFTQYLYNAKGEDVTQAKDENNKALYPASMFAWYIRDETSQAERLIGTGYSKTINISSVGYGAHIIGEFTLTEESYLMTPDDKYLVMPNDLKIKIMTDRSNTEEVSNG